jgi:hypothetical protein
MVGGQAYGHGDEDNDGLLTGTATNVDPDPLSRLLTHNAGFSCQHGVLGLEMASDQLQHGVSTFQQPATGIIVHVRLTRVERVELFCLGGASDGLDEAIPSEQG